jgi:hypothetical protein
LRGFSIAISAGPIVCAVLRKISELRLKTPENTRKNSKQILQGYFLRDFLPLNFPWAGCPIVCVDFRCQLISETQN